MSPTKKTTGSGSEEKSTSSGTARSSARKSTGQKPAGRRKPAARKTSTGKPAAQKPATGKKTSTPKPAAQRTTRRKPAAAKKTSTRKPAAKKPAGRKPAAAKRTSTSKPRTKKTAAQKTATQTSAKKTSAKKTSAKKTSAKKTSAKKTSAKKPTRRRAREPAKLDAKSLAAINSELEDELAELRRAESEMEEGSSDGTQSEVSGEVGIDEDFADAGTATFDRERDFSIQNNLLDLIDQVTRALGRIEDGTYGSCERCGRPIDRARLKARPRTLLCMDCKRREERAR